MAKKSKSTKAKQASSKAQKPAESRQPKLGPGDFGQDVRALQEALNTHGRPVTLTGVFDEQTTRAVDLYRRQHSLTLADGPVVDKAMWEKLKGPRV